MAAPYGRIKELFPGKSARERFAMFQAKVTIPVVLEAFFVIGSIGKNVFWAQSDFFVGMKYPNSFLCIRFCKDFLGNAIPQVTTGKESAPYWQSYDAFNGVPPP